MKLTGAAILVSRGMKVLQAAPAAYPYRSAAMWGTSMFILPLLADWTPLQLMGLIGVLTAAALVMTGLLFWRRLGLAQADAAWKQAMLERGLSVDEIERLLRPAALLNDDPDTQSAAPELPLSDEQLVEKLANILAAESASDDTIQGVMGAFNASDPPSKRLLYHALVGLSDGFNASDEQILAVVRGLCRLDAEGVGKWQNSEAKLALPATATGGKWDAQGIRAEPLYGL